MQFEVYTVNHPNIGNVMYRKDSITHQYENFTYDNLDRLTGITYLTQPIQSITYSGNGNIASKYNGGTYAYDPTKVHAVTSVTKTHGAASQALQDITYTRFNKAETVIQKTTGPVIKTLTYALTYGPDEQRVKSIYTDTLNSVTTRYYAGNYEKELKGTVIRQIHYIMGGTGLVAVYIKKNTDSGNLYYVCTDRQGSITALLNANGTVAEKYSYDAYGRRRNPINWTDYNVPAPTLINRGYTGHEHLDGFGLINMNGRMYDPVIGRVLSPDKVVQAPGYTQSYNRYSYCMNNPLKYSDPSGYTYYDGMKSLYNYEGGGFWYRGSYQQNTADGWVSWTQGFSGGNGGWSTGATPLHYSPTPGSEGYTNIDDKSFIDNGTGNIVPFDDVKTNFIQPNSEYVVLLFAGTPDDPYQIYTGYRVEENSSMPLHIAALRNVGMGGENAPNSAYTMRGNDVNYKTLFEEFKTGTGPEYSGFGADHAMVADLKNSLIVTMATEKFLAGGCKPLKMWDVPFGLAKIPLASQSMTEQFIGGARVSIFQTSLGYVYIVNNTTDWHSFSYHMGEAIPRVPGETTQYGTIYQRFMWIQK